MDASPRADAGEVRVCADAEALAHAAAELFLGLCASALAARGRFRVVLTGGSTPRRAYEVLASPPYRDQVDWSKVDFFWGDERYVPPDHPLSNYRMAREALLQRVPVPETNIHRIPTEINPPPTAAQAYEDAIRQCFTMPTGVPRFDLVFMGLGPNGHTASLFPHSPLLHEAQRLVAADYVEEVSMWRITMTLPLLNAGRVIAFLVSGSEKAAVLRDVLDGPRDPERLPAQLVRATDGELLWLVDRAAAVSAA